MTSKRRRKLQASAWTLGVSGALACAATLGATVGLGLFSPQSLVCLIFITTGLLGALVASHAPGNSVGWLMCVASLAAVLLFLPLDYGYTALVVEHGSWPLGGVVLWLAAWAWAPLAGMFFSVITIRFPDGKVPPGWRATDWLAIAGTTFFALSLALAPSDVLLGFLPLSQGRPLFLLSSMMQNPTGIWLPADLLGQMRTVGLALVGLSGAVAVASLVGRFRHARGEERLQLKWFAYSCVLVALGIVYVPVASIFLRQPYGDANLPLDVAAFTLPIAIAIAILRYRMYDIDLISNRTLVYVSLTAILGAIYVAVITFLQRLFISLSGQKSDAAYVLTAFLVVGASSPVKDWLQRKVDRRLGGVTAAAALEKFSADVDAVVSVLDVHRVACQLVDQAVVALNARGAALYLDPRETTNPLYSRGHLNGEPVLEVPLRHEGTQFGRLALGGRRGDITYTKHDRDALQRSADSVGEALALAAHFGHRPLAKSQ
jgi:two-component system, NarL family, sensor kinase